MFFFLLFLLSATLLISCGEGEISERITEKKACFSSFSFLAENNPTLMTDTKVELDEDLDTIVVHLRGVDLSMYLKPSFTGVFEKVEVGGVIQVSGLSSQVFSSIVKYDVIVSKNNKKSYYVKVVGENLIPRIDIYTKNNQKIESKEEYVNGEIRISNSPEYGIVFSECEIRGRGNYTWQTYPKKPYKVKLETKRSILGLPANNDWVLLAEYVDKSLMRTAYMCEVSRAMGMKYTVNYKYVDLYLNGEYRGVYLLTDFIEKGKDRVNCDSDGFIVEQDAYYKDEPLYYVTDSNLCFHLPYTFKYPKNMSADTPDFIFIADYLNNAERSLKEISEGSKSYLNYIDIESIAKWFIACEVLTVYDQNIYMILKSRESKLEFYPLWDFEWSNGLAEMVDGGWVAPPAIPNVKNEIMCNYPYIKELLNSELFILMLKNEWRIFRNKLPILKQNLRTVKEQIKYAQSANFVKWPTLHDYITATLIVKGSWEQEVEYVNDFFDKRVEWCEDYFLKILPERYYNSKN